MGYLYVGLTLIFVLIFNLWIQYSENAEALYIQYLLPYVDDLRIPVIFVLFLIALLAILSSRFIKKKDQEIAELGKKLNSEMELLISSNMQLSEYRKNELFSVLFDRFIEAHPYVIAVQMYTYTEQNNLNNVDLKLAFSTGSVAERVNINAAHQIYYRVEKNRLRKFKEGYTKLQQDDPNQLLDFVLDTWEKLSAKETSRFDERDAAESALLVLSAEILENDFEIDLGTFDWLDPYKEVLNEYRMGLFNSSIMSEQFFYTFTHTKENEKFNRQYLTRRIEMNDGNKLLLIAMEPGIIDDDYRQESMDKISESFEDLLNEMKMVYNNSKEKG